MSHHTSRQQLEEIIRTGGEGTIRANGKTYRLVRSRYGNADDAGGRDADETTASSDE